MDLGVTAAWSVEGGQMPCSYLGAPLRGKCSDHP